MPFALDDFLSPFYLPAIRALASLYSLRHSVWVPSIGADAYANWLWDLFQAVTDKPMSESIRSRWKPMRNVAFTAALAFMNAEQPKPKERRARRKAANDIQARIRGRQARKEREQMGKAAVFIQTRSRGHLARKGFKGKSGRGEGRGTGSASGDGKTSPSSKSGGTLVRGRSNGRGERDETHGEITARQASPVRESHMAIARGEPSRRRSWQISSNGVAFLSAAADEDLSTGFVQQYQTELDRLRRPRVYPLWQCVGVYGSNCAHTTSSSASSSPSTSPASKHVSSRSKASPGLSYSRSLSSLGAFPDKRGRAPTASRSIGGTPSPLSAALPEVVPDEALSSPSQASGEVISECVSSFAAKHTAITSDNTATSTYARSSPMAMPAKPTKVRSSTARWPQPTPVRRRMPRSAPYYSTVPCLAPCQVAAASATASTSQEYSWTPSRQALAVAQTEDGGDAQIEEVSVTSSLALDGWGEEEGDTPVSVDALRSRTLMTRPMTTGLTYRCPPPKRSTFIPLHRQPCATEAMALQMAMHNPARADIAAASAGVLGVNVLRCLGYGSGPPLDVKPRTMAGLASPNARKKQDGLRPNQIPHVSTNSNTKTHLRMIATSASSRSAPVLRR